MNTFRISVIIPTLNGGAILRHTLKQLSVQSVKADELLIVDSSSNDDTVAIAKEFEADVIVVSRKEFDHGGTRSMAARLATGDILIFFTQDAVPVSHTVVAELIAPFTENSSIAICYGRQLPNQGASLSATALRMFNYPEESGVRRFSDKEDFGLKTVFVSNSCAAYRKKYLQEVDYFPEGVIFGEDTCSAGRLLQKGYEIAYVAEAEVFHSHNYSILEEFHRSFDIGVLHRSEHWLLETYGHAEGEGVKYLKFEYSMIIKEKKFYLLPVFFCRNFMKFLGYKLGRKYYVLPQWLRPKLSMYSAWWNKTKI